MLYSNAPQLLYKQNNGIKNPISYGNFSNKKNRSLFLERFLLYLFKINLNSVMVSRKTQTLIFYILIALNLVTLGYGIFNHAPKFIMLSVAFIVAFTTLIAIYKYVDKNLKALK